MISGLIRLQAADGDDISTCANRLASRSATNIQLAGYCPRSSHSLAIAI